MSDSLLLHRGYSGSIEVSIEDRCLYGKILFISDLISYEGNDVNELENSFKEAVDDYIEACEEKGTSPEVPFKGSFNIRIGEELHQRAAVAAKKSGLSLNEFVKNAVDAALNSSEVIQPNLRAVHANPIYGVPISSTTMLLDASAISELYSQRTSGLLFGTVLAGPALQVETPSPSGERIAKSSERREGARRRVLNS